MTDYNDGNWHGWNGGECPVHPKSVVQVVRGTDVNADVVTWKASDVQDCNWNEVGMDHSVIAFRVVKVHREPREFWVTHDAMGKIGVFGCPVRSDAMHEVIHVREVIE